MKFTLLNPTKANFISFINLWGKENKKRGLGGFLPTNGVLQNKTNMDLHDIKQHSD